MKNEYENWSKEDLIGEVKKLKNRKRYGLVWEEKQEDVILRCNSELPVLEEVSNLEINLNKKNNWNLVISGDNYHSLAVLNYTHKKRIDTIYIDPPYNTGNKDFIYNDKYVDIEDSYKHSKWLSFMSCRLQLARDLLKPTGLIFISINDIEQPALRLLCDEIFRGENFLANLVWQNKEGGGSSDSKHFRIKHEYIICYARDITKASISGDEITNLERYTQKDEFASIRGPYYLQKLGMGSIQYSTSLDYEIKTPDGGYVTPKDNNKGKKACWRWSKTKLDWGIKNGFIVFKQDSGRVWQVYAKQYLNCDNEGNAITREARPFGVVDMYSSTQGAKQLRNMGIDDFNYPKPLELISYIISKNTNQSSLVLDFFAGSGTTGHATLELNKQDGGNRSFILCTDNENGIAENVCHARLKKAINGYKNGDFKVEGLGGNLKFYKTSFVKATNTDSNKVLLTEKAVDMLCLKEETFNTVNKLEGIRIFNNEFKHLAILLNTDQLNKFKQTISKLETPVSVYIFSLSNDLYEDEFEEFGDKVTISPIPEAIYKVYKRIFQ